MAQGSKHRLWEAFVSVSASGPEFSTVFKQSTRALPSRMAADLDYTTADVDFFYHYFTDPEPDRPRLGEQHFRLVNPTRKEVEKTLSEALIWLESFRGHPDWDGGGLHFNYAGHGREPDGSLVLADSDLSVDEFLAILVPQARKISSPGRLRLSVVLDSCHSGAWITRILDSCFNGNADCIIPFNLFAGCMQDEFAQEEPTIGHGLFTYCFSVQPKSIGAYAAEAILPDNSVGPSLSIGSGERGCSLLSAGAQNPVAYFNGAGVLEVSQESFSIENENGDVLSEAELNTELRVRRDRIRKVMAAARPDLLVGTITSDSEMRAAIRTFRDHLES